MWGKGYLMRIKKISLLNFRQYQDTEISFSKSGDHDLHLLIGKNSAGKTNLLNAISWCLYEQEPHLGIKDKALPLVNLDCLDKTEKNNSCKVKVEIETESDSGDVIFRRTAEFRKSQNLDEHPTRIQSKFEVTRIKNDGNTEIAINDDAKNWVNRYFPLSIREFFFFDGEQLDSYFITSNNSRIEAPIYKITQVDLLTKITDHLNSAIDELKKKAGSKNPDLTDLLKKEQEARKDLDEVISQLGTCKAQIDEADRIVRINTEKLRGQDDIEIFEKKKIELTEERKILNTQIENAKSDLKDFIKEYSIYINFFPHIKKTLEIINKKEREKKLPPNIDKNYLLKMLQSKECLVCESPLSESGKEHIKKLITDLQMSSEVSHSLISIKGQLESIIDKTQKFDEEKRKFLSALSNLENHKIRVEQDYNANELKLLTFSDVEGVKRLIAQRKQNEDLFAENHRTEGILLEQKKQLENSYEKAHKEYEEGIKKVVGNESILKSKGFAERAHQIVVESKQELIDEIREMTRQDMEEYFLSLIWTANKYQKVTLDENYSLGLLHKDGYECIGACGAAERALLALSFTLALHKVSGFDSPIIIDTPVARIADENRLNFANVLNETSRSKQMILLFTSAEYSQEIESTFTTSISSKHIINPKSERISQIERSL